MITCMCVRVCPRMHPHSCVSFCAHTFFHVPVFLYLSVASLFLSVLQAGSLWLQSWVSFSIHFRVYKQECDCVSLWQCSALWLSLTSASLRVYFVTRVCQCACLSVSIGSSLGLYLSPGGVVLLCVWLDFRIICVWVWASMSVSLLLWPSAWVCLYSVGSWLLLNYLSVSMLLSIRVCLYSSRSKWPYMSRSPCWYVSATCSGQYRSPISPACGLGGDVHCVISNSRFRTAELSGAKLSRFCSWTNCMNRRIYSTIADYTFFPSAHGIFTKRDHVLDYKTHSISSKELRSWRVFLFIRRELN